MMMQRAKFIFYSCFLCVFVLTVCSSRLLAATPSFLPATDTINFVSVADIHFNPFYTCDKKNKSCPIINKLAIASVTEWPSIFNKYDTQAARYKEDTNYILLKSTLQQLKKTGRTQHPQFVLVLGDFLSHNFKENYQYFTGDSSEKGAQNFIDKTLEFLSFELAKTFPHIDIYMVVGNNDSYAKHYTSQAVFYKNIAPLWSVLIQDKKNRAEMQKEFAQGGYYALSIQKNLRLIVLNTTYFSTRGRGMDPEAQRELNWLGKQLRLLDKTHTKALIALHIPQLAEVSISHTIPVAALGLWQMRYIDQFLHLLKCSASHIVAVLPAHLHMDWAQLLQFKGVAHDVLISATPSISPVVGNNPAYKVYYFDPKQSVLTDYLTYYYPLDEHQWKLEYAFNQTYQANCKACTVALGLKQLAKNAQYLKAYKKFFSVDRSLSIFSNLTYPTLVCDLPVANDTAYKLCVNNASVL